MKRKEFFKILIPLVDKLYSLSFSLLPDDLQAEQLVIDSVNAYLFRERKWVLNREINFQNQKEVTIFKKIVFRSLVKNLIDIGLKRSVQLSDLTASDELGLFQEFFRLDAKSRLVVRLSYEFHFDVDEIADLFELPRYEIIQKIHNAKHLLLTDKSIGLNP